MKATFAAIATAATLVFAAPASAQGGCCQVVPVVVDPGVWVNPGVYVSHYSHVTRNYPYVGCCLPAHENWSYARPYTMPRELVLSRAALVPVPLSERRRLIEAATADRLHYPDGRRIDRFNSPAPATSPDENTNEDR